MDLMRKITKKDSSWIPSKDKTLKTLCDQFSQNVMDNMLRKHLKQIVRRHPGITFLDLREEAILWSEEEEYSDKHKTSKTKSETTSTENDVPNREFNQLLDIVKKQSEQIEALTKVVNLKQHAYSNQDGYRQKSHTLICYGCKKPGHKINDCPNRSEKKPEN